MHRIYLLCVIIIACNNNQPKTKNLSVSKDSPTVQRTNSIPQSSSPIDHVPPVQFKDSIQVHKIKPIIAKIDNTRIKDSVYLENDEFMKNMIDGGGSLTGYFQNGKLVKIAEWYGLSWGVLQVSYYFENDNLVFVKETEDHFYVDDSTGTDQSRFDLQFRGEYYFNNGRLFDEVSLGHNRFEDSANDPEKEYIRRAKENKGIILKHKTK